MKVVVTGSAGLLGRVVVAELAQYGHEVLGLDRIPQKDADFRAWTIDLLDMGSLYQALIGVDAVIHLAGHNAPGHTADTRVFNDNVALTYNVLRAATDLGIGRLVVASSIGAYGFLYRRDKSIPKYLPLDEKHPVAPTDPYGLSKVVGEQIADAFARLGGVSISSLRFPGINNDPEFRRIFRLMDDPGFRAKGFWTYIDARDAARACRLAIELETPGHRVINVAAPNSNMREDTADLIRRFWPKVDFVKRSDGNWSGLDSSLAQDLLGFEAQYTWDKIDGSTA